MKFILDLALLDVSGLHINQKRLIVLTAFNRKRKNLRKKIQHKFIVGRSLNTTIKAHCMNIMLTTLLARWHRMCILDCWIKNVFSGLCMLSWKKMKILVIAKANSIQFRYEKKNIIFVIILIVLIHQILRQLKMPDVHLKAIYASLHIGTRKQYIRWPKRVGIGFHNKQSILGLIICLFVYKQ